MDLVEMPVVQSRFDIVEEFSAAEVAAGTQFVAVQLFAQRISTSILFAQVSESPPMLTLELELLKLLVWK